MANSIFWAGSKVWWRWKLEQRRKDTGFECKPENQTCILAREIFETFGEAKNTWKIWQRKTIFLTLFHSVPLQISTFVPLWPNPLKSLLGNQNTKDWAKWKDWTEWNYLPQFKPWLTLGLMLFQFKTYFCIWGNVVEIWETQLWDFIAA